MAGKNGKKGAGGRKKKPPRQAVADAPVVTGGDTALTVYQPTTIDPGAAATLFGPPPPTGKKKEPIVIPARQDDINALISVVNSQYKGRVLIRSGANITNVFMLRRPTGIMNLDLSIGGGLPAGGLTQIIGKDSSGKSYLANRVMAEVQNTYGDQAAIAVCMTEQRYDKHFSKWKCGVRIALSPEEIAVLEAINAQYGRPAYTTEQIAWLQDQIGFFTETVGATAEEILEAAAQQIESNLFQVVEIDSFGALLTMAEAEHEEGIAGKHRGGAAMPVTQFMHRMHSALNMPDKYGRPNTTTVIGINQYRDNVNAGMYGNPLKQAGGNSLKHGKLLDILLEQGARQKMKVGSEDRVIGKEIRWEIIKGKAGCHDGPKGSYTFYFGEHGYGFGVDVYSDLLVAAMTAGVVDLSGAWYSYQGERLGQGKEQVAWNLHQHPEIMQSIRRDILKNAGLNFITREGV